MRAHEEEMLKNLQLIGEGDLKVEEEMSINSSIDSPLTIFDIYSIITHLMGTMVLGLALHTASINCLLLPIKDRGNYEYL